MSNKKFKPIRLATNKNYPDGTVEWLEISENGVVLWKMDNESPAAPFSCSFPVDIDFVKEFFSKINREFDESKLPQNIVKDPYACWLSMGPSKRNWS